jgi:MOSC domain-containing protein YiiM
MWSGRVVSIHITPEGGAPTLSVPEVRAVAGKGLEGDRYFSGAGTYSGKAGPFREVTLIEIEAIEGLAREYQVALDPGESRRNVVTRGVPLNHLVDREFRVGEARLRGIRLCEPCGHMEELAGKPGARKGLLHRGGLRAQILDGGTIRVGDPVSPPETLPEP